MISAALEGKLNNAIFSEHRVFGIAVPNECPGVSTAILNPKNTWKDKKAYDKKANTLCLAFNENFSKYEESATKEMLLGTPKFV